jgi:MFS family permease
LAVFILDHAPWRAIFFINLPLATAAFLVTAIRVPEARFTPGRKMDWSGGCLAVLWLGTLAYGLTAMGEANSDRVLSVIAIVLGCFGLLAFLVHEAATSSPMMPVALFSSALFLGVNGLTFFLYFALSGALFFLPSVLIDAHGYSATLAGSVFLPFTLVVAILSRIAGNLTQRLGLRFLLTLGPALTAVSFLLLIPATGEGSFWSAVVPVMALMGIGMGITVTPLSTAVMNAVPTDRAGVASAVNNAISRVAGLVAVASLGVAASTGFRQALAGATAPDRVIAVLNAFGVGALAQAEQHIEPSMRAELIGLGSAATLRGFAFVALISAGGAGFGALVAFSTVGRRGPTVMISRAESRFSDAANAKIVDGE